MKKFLFALLFGACVVSMGHAQPRRCRLHSQFVGLFTYVNTYVNGRSSRYVESIPVGPGGDFVFSLPRVYSSDLAEVSRLFPGTSCSNPSVQVAMLNFNGTLSTGATHNEYMGPSYNSKRSYGTIQYVYSTGSCYITGSLGGMNVSLNLRAGWNAVQSLPRSGSLTTVNSDMGWSWGTD